METNTAVITHKQFTNGSAQQPEQQPQYGGKPVTLRRLILGISQ